MSQPDTSWFFCVASDALSVNKILEIQVGEKPVCLLRNTGKVFAFSATCPHSGAKLCEGRTDAQGRIVCPLHGYRFNPENGYNTSGEGYKLKTYTVKEEDGQIFVQL